MGRRPLLSELGEKARALGAKAARDLLATDVGAEALGGAVKRMQAVRGQLDLQGTRMLAAMGFATEADVERVSRKLGRLRKRLQGLLDRL
ncbi:MAG: hypothetical protein HY903_05315 [Deltaproteobacteria bacterium]|nr:hypothetical protein [Deltaproteobacteria bacterium]